MNDSKRGDNRALLIAASVLLIAAFAFAFVSVMDADDSDADKLTGSIDIAGNQIVRYSPDGAVVSTVITEDNAIIYEKVTDGTIHIKWYADNEGSKGDQIQKAAGIGTYWVGISADESDTYNAVPEVARSFTIIKADPVIDVEPQAKTLYYNGEPQELLTPGHSIGGTLKYCGDTMHYSESIPTRTEPGTYTVAYKVIGDEYYNTGTYHDVSITILPRQLTDDMIVITGSYTYNWGTQSVQFEISDNGLITADDWEHDNGSEIQGKDAGTYTIKIKAKGGHYSGTASKTWVIDQIDLDTSATHVHIVESMVFNGETRDNAPTVYVGDTLIEYGTDYSYDGAGGKDVGQYHVTVTGKGNFKNTTQPVDWEITPFNIVGHNSVVFTNPTYTGSSQTLSYTVYAIIGGHNYLMTEGADFIANGKTGTNVDNYSLDIEAAGNYEGDVTCNWAILPLDISGATVVLAQDVFTYSGMAVSLSATVAMTYGGSSHTLVADTDYDISDGKINAGSYYAHLTGIGNFTGENDSAGYTINALSIATAAITLDGKILIFNNTNQTMNVTKVHLKVGLFDRDLVASTEYTVTGNVQKNAGAYQLTVSGTGNFSGSVQKDWSIEKLSITTASIFFGNTITYNGEEQTRSIEWIKVDSITVPAGSYTVTGNKATNAGTYSLTVTAKSDSNFTGSHSWDWDILQLSLSGATIVSDSPKTYDGTEKTITISSVTVGTVGVDLSSVTVSGNKATDAGTYTLTVTAKNDTNYSGSKSVDWKIQKLSISDAVITVSETSFVYNGTPRTVSVTKVHVSDGGSFDRDLVPTTEYTVAGNTGTNADSYTLTVTGTGNFSGSKDVDWTISRLNLIGATVTLGPTHVYDGTAFMQSVTKVHLNKSGFDGDLSSGTDYTTSSQVGVNAGTYTLSVSGTGNFTGMDMISWDIEKLDITGATITLGAALIYNGSSQTQTITSVVKNSLAVTYDVTDNVQKNHKSDGNYELTVTGNGNFKGTETAEWNIAQKALTNGMINSMSPFYDGASKELAIVVDGGKCVFSDDWIDDGSVSTATNVNADGYLIKIKAADDGNYSGSAQSKWYILPLSISDATITLGDALTYNGSSQTQTITSVIKDSLTVTFDVSGNVQTNHKSDGNYVLTVTGNGNFIGTATKEWNITQRDLSNITVEISSDPMVYNGSVQTVQFVASDPLGTGVLTSGDYAIDGTSNKGTNAGSYTLQLNADASGNYTGTKTQSWSISKAPTDVITTEFTAEYDGTAHIPQASDLIYGSCPVRPASEYIVIVPVGPCISAGQHKVAVTVFSTDDNFEPATDVEVTYTITKRALSNATITITSGAFTYDGTQKTLLFDVTDGDPSIIASSDWAVNGSSDKATKAGSHTLTLTAADSGNYDGEKTIGWKIGKRALSNATITITSGAFTYDGTQKTLTFNVADGDPSIIKSSDWRVNSSSNKATDAGSYTLTITATATGNYTGNQTCPWNIAKADISSISVSSSYAPSYDGSSHIPSNSDLVYNSLSVRPDSSKVSITGPADPINAGSKTVTVTVTGDGNFNDCTTSVTYTISKVTITSVVVDYSATYSGEERKPAYSDMIYNELSVRPADANVTMTFPDGAIAAGEQRVRIVVSGDPNFNDADIIGTYTIDKRDISNAVISMTQSSFVYKDAQIVLSFTVTDSGGTILETDWEVYNNTDRATNVNSYTLKIVATPYGNYTGEKTASWSITPCSIADAEITLGTALVYNGSNQTQTVSKVHLTTVSGIDRDLLTTEYTVTDNVQKNHSAGNYLLKVNGSGNFSGTATKAWNIAQKALTNDMILPAQCTYDGALKQLSIVVDGGKCMPLDDWVDDGSVSSAVNVNSDGYLIKIKATDNGNYSGSAQSKWYIDPLNISGAAITLGSLLTYNGSPQTQTVTSVIKDGLAVTFDVSDNVQTYHKSSGNYSLTVTGTNNFSGTETKEWNIAPLDISGATIHLGVALTYNGKVQTQTVTSVIKDTLSVTYTVTGNTAMNHNADSDYTLTVTGTGNFCGTETRDWNIGQKTLTADMIVPGSYTYNGSEQSLSITVDGGKAIEGSDWEDYGSTVKGTNVGSYNIKIRTLPDGNYTGGTVQSIWAISALDIAGATITLGTALTYNGSPQTQTVTSVIKNGLTVTYAVTNNKQTNVKTDGSYMLTVTGNGNFSGTETKEWNIAPLDISGATITLGDALTYNGSPQTQTVTSVIKNGLTVTFDVSDNVQTNHKSDGNYVLTVTGTNNFTGTETKGWNIGQKAFTDDMIVWYGTYTYDGSIQNASFSVDGEKAIIADDYTMDPSSEMSATNAGTYAIKINATSDGNYSGSAQSTWTIERKSIEGAEITLAGSLTYNGSQQTMNISQVRVNEMNLYSYDYTVTGNTATDAGKHTMTLTGVGNFTGTETKEWNIGRLSLSSAVITLDSQTLTYNFDLQTKSISTVYLDYGGFSGYLTETDDYMVSGNTAIDAGTYSLTITGCGNFQGTANKGWSISQRPLSEGGVMTLASDTFVYKEGLYAVSETVTVTVSSVPHSLYKGVNYTLSGDTGTNVNMYTAVATGIGNFCGTLECNWHIDQLTLESATIVLEESSFVYNGSSHTQNVTSVHLNFGGVNRYLVSGTEFSIEDNTETNAGIYSLKVNGEGNFTGTATAEWSISRIDGWISITDNQILAYTGSNIVAAESGIDVILYTKETDGNIVVRWFTDDGGSLGTEIPFVLHPGTYNVVINAEEGQNYNAVSQQWATFTVTKATPSFLAAPEAIADLYYTGASMYLVTDAVDVRGYLKYSLDDQSYSVDVPTATDAGNYTVYYKFVENEDYLGSMTYSFPVSIDKAAGSIIIESGQMIGYNGTKVIAYYAPTDHAVIYTVKTEGDLTITWYADNSGTCGSALAEAPTEIGTYWLGISAAESKNYYPVSETKQSFQIVKGKVEWPHIQSKIYTGTTLTADVPASDRYTVTENLGGIDVGTYPVELTLIDFDHYEWSGCPDYASWKVIDAFKIMKNTGNDWIEDLWAVSFEYNGETAVVGTHYYAEAKYGDVIYTFYTSETGGSSIPLSSVKNAGSYWVTAKVEDTAGYSGIDETARTPFEITKVQLTVSGTIVKDKTYNGKTDDASLVVGTVTGIISGDDVTVGATGSYASKVASESVSVSVTYSISGDDSANYIAPVSSSVTGKINRAQLTVSGTTVDDKVYNGKTDDATIVVGTVTGIISGDDVTVGATGSYASKDASDSVSVSVMYFIIGADVANYFTPVLENVNGKIAPATPMISVNPKNTIYSGNAVPLDAAAVTLVNSEIYSGTVEYRYYTDPTCTEGETSVAPVDAGYYYAKAFTAAFTNYAAGESDATYIFIDRATPVVTLTDKTATYSGASVPADPAIVTLVNSEVYTGQVTYVYYTNPECTEGASVDAPVNAGHYYAKALVFAFKNYYSAASNAVSIVIDKKALSNDMISVNGPFIYDNTVKTVTFTVSDGTALTPADWTDDTGTQKSGIEMGKYTVRIKATDAGNYSGTASKDWYINGQKRQIIEDGKLIAEFDFGEKGIRNDAVIDYQRTSNVPDEIRQIIGKVNGEPEYMYGFVLKVDGHETQPEGKVVIKLLIPDNVKGASFDIYQVHGLTSEKVDYVIEGDYVIIETDDISEFVFVKKNSFGGSTALYVLLGIISAIAVLIFAVYFRK